MIAPREGWAPRRQPSPTTPRPALFDRAIRVFRDVRKVGVAQWSATCPLCSSAKGIRFGTWPDGQEGMDTLCGCDFDQVNAAFVAECAIRWPRPTVDKGRPHESG